MGCVRTSESASSLLERQVGVEGNKTPKIDRFILCHRLALSNSGVRPPETEPIGNVSQA